VPVRNGARIGVDEFKRFPNGGTIRWPRVVAAKTLVTTPNSDVIYAMSYLDLGKDGPMVFEAPPGLQGVLLDFWQRPIPGPKIGTRAYFGDVGSQGLTAARAASS
jgi:hypothetical protein